MDQPAPESTGTYRPRLLLFGTLSAVWCFASLSGMLILSRLPKSPASATVSLEEKLRAMPIEGLIALALIWLHAIFIALAVQAWFSEKPRPVPPSPTSEGGERPPGA